MMVKVTGTDFVRDVNSMGLSNINSNEKQEYYAKQKMLSIQKQEINKLKEEFTDLKSDIQELKELMALLIKKGQNG